MLKKDWWRNFVMLTELRYVTEWSVRELGLVGIYIEVHMCVWCVFIVSVVLLCWVFHRWLCSTGVRNSRDLKDIEVLGVLMSYWSLLVVACERGSSSCPAAYHAAPFVSSMLIWGDFSIRIRWETTRQFSYKCPSPWLMSAWSGGSPNWLRKL